MLSGRDEFMSFYTDPFLPAIVTDLQNWSDTNSLNWTVVGQDSPNRKEWNPVPMVIVCPSIKQNVNFIGFCSTRTVNGYDCYLVATGNLASNFDNLANNFFTVMLNLFMPPGIVPLSNEGAYMTKVVPKYDYDRSAFPRGWSSTCVSLNVFNVNQ